MEKTSYEEFPIYFNFKNDLSASETVASYVLTCVDADGNDSSSSIVTASSLTTPRVKVSIKGGVHGGIHKVTVRATTAFGDVIEKEVWLTINDYRDDGTFYMQPNENILFAWDFVNHLDEGDTISTKAAAIIKTSDETDVSATSLKGTGQDGTKIIGKIGSVADGEIYRAVCKIVTASGDKFQMNVNAVVQEA